MLATRLTERLGLRHPIVLAPMAFVAGGRLAAEVSRAGGLGMIGGGYGDSRWLEQQFDLAGDAVVGVGFITWALAEAPDLLNAALARRPRAVLLSFGDPTPFVSAIRRAGAVPMCQVQTREDAVRAIQAGAEIVVAQGSEAGGHGAHRATMTLVPEVADLARSQGVLVLAAGGIADGRGLAAALALGADGAVMGTRFWMAHEALSRPAARVAAGSATGDATMRTHAVDRLRGYDWPAGYAIRVLRNAFVERWHEAPPDADWERARGEYERARTTGDAAIAATVVGEGIGLIERTEPAAVLVERIVAEATAVIAAMVATCRLT